MDKKYNNFGFIGLKNLGNTCFLNSCLQVLNNTYELNILLDNKIKKKDDDDGLIFDEWNDLRKLMWNHNGVISPDRFVKTVHKVAREKRREIFTGWSQNDISEFLLFMMECIHNSISRSVNVNINGTKVNNIDELAVKCYNYLKDTYNKDYSEINDIFYGLQITSILSIDNKITHSIKPEQYFILDLPIPNKNNITLYDCFDLYTENEEMKGENAWFNDKTKQKEDIIKKITFWNFPNILVITLKRFSVNGKNKRNDLVDFPLNALNLSKYICGYRPDTFIYELYAICNHSGNVYMGHYTAFVKNYTNNWYLFNDNNIQKITETKNIITPMAYCLFYRKKK